MTMNEELYYRTFEYFLSLDRAILRKILERKKKELDGPARHNFPRNIHLLEDTFIIERILGRYKPK